MDMVLSGSRCAEMSRRSSRRPPLDIHKKLLIIKSINDFEDDEMPAAAASTSNSQLPQIAAEADNEVHQSSCKRSTPNILTPQCSIVDTYERDYSCTFTRPTSYLRRRGVRSEIGEFVEYDLDDEDEDWLQEFNNEKKILAPEKFETILFKLEVLDHKTREIAGIIAPTIGASIPVLLELDAAAEALQVHSVRNAVFQSVYNYWKAKRKQWQKPILRRLQPPPPVNDTNPYNVFRPREKDHCLHTRRMQRRENDVQSFEKLRQVRRNLCQAKTVLKTLIKREEKKQEVIESIFSVQRIQLEEKNEAQLVEDGVAFPGFPSNSYRYGSSDDDYVDSDNTSNYHPHAQSPIMQHSAYLDSWLIVIPTGRMKGELKQRPRSHGWFHEPHEPVMLFTNPLDPERLADAGIIWPLDHPIEDGSVAPPHCFHSRMGRGGRIIFDRWNPLLQSPVDHESSSPVPRNDMPPPPSG